MKNKCIPYSDDVACLPVLKKFHRNGYRNIFSVRISYVRPENDGHRRRCLKRKEYRMDYGSFMLANERYNIEIGPNCSAPFGWHMDEIKMVLMTYNGTELVNEDVMHTVKFGEQMSYPFGL